MEDRYMRDHPDSMSKYERALRKYHVTFIMINQIKCVQLDKKGK